VKLKVKLKDQEITTHSVNRLKIDEILFEKYGKKGENSRMV